MEKKFTPDMLIIDALEMDDGAAGVFESFGLPCSRCAVAEAETIEEGARSKGISPEKILARLNSLLDEKETQQGGQSPTTVKDK